MTGGQFTVGVLTPHEAGGPEIEIPAMTRGRITTVLSRTGPARDHAQLRASTEPAAVDLAAVAFGSTTLAAVAHASTTSGYVIGHREEAELSERLSQRFGVPATTSCAAAVAALRTHGVERVQLVHPPWFDEELDGLGAAYFRRLGFEAVVTKAVDLPNDPARVERGDVIDWVERHVEDRTEALLFAGNGFRAAEAIEELERRTGRLVLEANQVLLWAVLAATGSGWDISGYGRLLQADTSTR